MNQIGPQAAMTAGTEGGWECEPGRVLAMFGRGGVEIELRTPDMGHESQPPVRYRLSTPRTGGAPDEGGTVFVRGVQAGVPDDRYAGRDRSEYVGRVVLAPDDGRVVRFWPPREANAAQLVNWQSSVVQWLVTSCLSGGALPVGVAVRIVAHQPGRGQPRAQAPAGFPQPGPPAPPPAPPAPPAQAPQVQAAPWNLPDPNDRQQQEHPTFGTGMPGYRQEPGGFS